MEKTSGTGRSKKRFSAFSPGWENVFNSMSDLITVHDKDFHIVYANEAARKTLGLPSLNGKQIKCYKYYHGTDKPHESCLSGRCLSTGAAVAGEIFEEHLKSFFEITMTPLFDDAGRTSNIVHIFRDITRYRQTEKQMKETITIAEEEEAKSKAVLEAVGYGVSIQDTDFRILYQNKKHKEMTGYHVGEFCYSAYQGRDTLCERCHLAMAFQDGETHILEQSKDTENGLIYCEIVGTPIKDPSGKVIAGMEVVRDITDRKHVEDELQRHRDELINLVHERTAELSASNELLRQEIIDRQQAEHHLKVSERKYRDLYDNAPDMYHSLNRDRVIIECNETEARMLGYRKEEIIGRPITDFYDEESKRRFEKDFMLLTEEKGLKNIERTFIRKDGTTFPVIINVFAETGENGDIIRIRAIARDITELKRAKAERELAQAEALRVSHLASLGELAAGVAHEINNPVNGILNYAQMLANKSAHETREYDIANRIIRESERIATIVKSLLSFTRSAKEEKTAVHIKDMISEVLALTEAQIRKDGILLEVNFHTELPDIIANPQQIEQVFLNIISNSRYALNEKFPETYPYKKIEITGERILIKGVPFIRIIFRDNGTGIPPGHLGKVMNPFFSTKPPNVGTGLGLSISHGIVSNHGGNVMIDSDFGEYTRVTVELPERPEII
ncbi:MAG: PAS domain S-box protein [Nitrospiraceae bacterium]|nr:MAG: PAS domain S-box protein [Nitrospiraceae bacterium]